MNRHWQAIPQLEVGYGRTVERVERLAAELEGIFLAGGVLGAYGLPDSIASGRRAGEAVAEHLARAPSVAPAGGP